jgi:hypothetical protein
VFDEQEDHPAREEEEDVLRKRVRGIDVTGRVDHRRDHQEDEGGPDRIPTVQAGPDRVGQIGDEETDKDRSVRNVHRSSVGSGPGV